MINPVSNILQPSVAPTGGNGTAASNVSFSKILGESLDKVANMENEAANLGNQLAAGQGTDMHTVMIASEKASLAVQLTVQVRNKAVEAYQEIMRMQM